MVRLCELVDDLARTADVETGDGGTFMSQLPRLVGDDKNTHAPYPNVDMEYEWISEVADDAETWINEQIKVDGVSFGWHDGEWFLQSQEW